MVIGSGTFLHGHLAFALAVALRFLICILASAFSRVGPARGFASSCHEVMLQTAPLHSFPHQIPTARRPLSNIKKSKPHVEKFGAVSCPWKRDLHRRPPAASHAANYASSARQILANGAEDLDNASQTQLVDAVASRNDVTAPKKKKRQPMRCAALAKTY